MHRKTNISALRIFFVLFGLVTGSEGLAYTLRCDASQSKCEVVTGRLVKGDKVGVFDSSGYLVAIGNIISARGKVKVVKIERKFAQIQSSHTASLIKDSEAANPEKYFKLLEKVAKEGYGIHAGLINMGVGEGLSATAIDGFYEYRFDMGLYLLGRIGYITGSGKASYTGDEIASYSVDFSGLYALGGASYQLFSNKFTSLRAELSLGLIDNSVSAEAGTISTRELVDGRIYSGSGMILKGLASVLIRLGDTRPFVGAGIYRLQNSINPEVHLGIIF